MVGLKIGGDLSDIGEEEEFYSRPSVFKLCSHKIFDRILDKLPAGHQLF
jgi:hypothetical protein